MITGNTYTKYYSESNGLSEILTINGIEYTNNIVYNESSKAESIKYSDGSIVEYTYDNNGNIIIVKENDNIISEYKYDQLNKLISEIDYVHDTIMIIEYDMYDNIKLLS